MGERIGEYTLGPVEVREVTGLQAVSDPGYIPALIGFILSVIGLVWTYVQKFKKKEL